MNRTKFDESGDSKELQALFDSIAAQPARPRLEVVSEPEPVGDSDELQALFDAVACDNGHAKTGQELRWPAAGAGASQSEAAEPRPAAGPVPIAEEVFNRVGHMARQLHDSLHELGYDRMLEQTARAIPDARQRLTYIAQMTEQAASRVLNAIDVAKPIQTRMQSAAEELAARWDKLFGNQLSTDQFKVLAADTREFLRHLPEDTRATDAQLMEIMLAQDFQDLTGQVIKRVVDMAQGMEHQLVHLLVQVTPEGRRSSAEGLLNGPVVRAAGGTDVLINQTQVDELLETLGF